jgi:hypothetical protein
MATGTSNIGAAGGNGVIGTGGDLNGKGAPGTPGIRLSGTVILACGSGGSSQLGGGGGPRTTDGAGENGTANTGGGGGGAFQDNNGGAQTGGVGGTGVIIVWEYA